MILMFYFNVCYQCIQRWLSFSGNIFLLTQTPLLCSKCSSSPCILAIIYTLLLTQGYNYRSTPLCCLHHQVFFPLSWSACVLFLLLLLLFSCQVVSDSFRSHELQHTRFPCPSLSAGVCSNSYPLNWWCDLTISFSAAPFSS